MKPIPLHFSEELVLKAVMAFWWRSTGWKFWMALSVTFASLIYLLWIGDRSWVTGICGSVFVLGLVFAGTLFFVHRRSSLERFHRLRSAQAMFEPNEQGFRISSEVGTINLRWTDIREIWLFPEFWLVLFSPAQFIILPLTDLDVQIREIVLDRATVNGVKMR